MIAQKFIQLVNNIKGFLIIPIFDKGFFHVRFVNLIYYNFFPLSQYTILQQRNVSETPFGTLCCRHYGKSPRE